jgi:hypothetical protein
MSVAFGDHINDEDVTNAAGILSTHRRRVYPDSRPGGLSRCQCCGQAWPCFPTRLAMQVRGVAPSAAGTTVGGRP